jgi:threonine aldolase
MQPWDGVIAAKTAHINTDECGAPERVAGIKVIEVDTECGKLKPDAIAPIVNHLQGFEHARQPKIISISNVAELGSMYSPEETKALADFAHSKGMYLHVDGARLANAAAAQGVSLAALSSEAGVDVLSLGGTKNGLMYGDAALWFGKAADEVKATSFMLCKASSMLGSKMRFLSAQFGAMYGTDLWHSCASHANAMALRLAKGLPKTCEIAFVDDALAQDDTQGRSLANELFAWMPAEIVPALQEEFHFYTWEAGVDGRDCVRWVTSWDTTEEEVDALLAAIHKACS